MKTQSVELVIPPRPPHFVGDGFRVHNFIPSVPGLSMQRMSPFIMLDYNSAHYFSPSNTPRGVGVHPHRGFETVTIAYKGSVAHHDSSGGGGVIGEGDVQWMTAASGVLHKEFHEQTFSRTGGYFQMVQLWVNLPAKYKMSKPKYQAIPNSAMGRYFIPNEGGEVQVIAGQYQSVIGAASTFTPIHLYNAHLSKGAHIDFSFPANFHTALLVVEGSITINGQANAPTDHLVLMANDGGTHFTVQATDNALLLVLSGEPINEPIAAHGPFVMNTRQELIEAFDDFNKGLFGHLAD